MKNKRPLMYVFTGDLNPDVEIKAAKVGFLRAFRSMGKVEIEQIL